MVDQGISAGKKRRGRPATGRGEQIGVRLQPELLDWLDAERTQLDPQPSRPELIRNILADAKANQPQTVSPVRWQDIKWQATVALRAYVANYDLFNKDIQYLQNPDGSRDAETTKENVLSAFFTIGLFQSSLVELSLKSLLAATGRPIQNTHNCVKLWKKLLHADRVAIVDSLVKQHPDTDINEILGDTSESVSWRYGLTTPDRPLPQLVHKDIIVDLAGSLLNRARSRSQQAN